MKNSSPITTLRTALIGVLPAILVGVCIMRLYGSPWSMPITNIVAVLPGCLVVGLGSSALITRTSKRPVVVTALVLGTFAITLFDGGLEGVHRWLRIGPVRLHPAAIGTPILLLAIIIMWEQQKTKLAIIAVVMSLALHVAQPDAGQATAFAAGVIALVAIADKRFGGRLVLIILAVLGAATAWTRPDPLLGVAMVEDIIPEAFAMHSLLGVSATIALIMLPGSALSTVLRGPTNRIHHAYGFALTAYFLASLVVVGLGEFPTPVLGFGASPIMGAFLGLGLLAQLDNSEMSDVLGAGA